MTDLEALQAAAVTTWALLYQFVFPGETEFLRDLREQTIEAQSFRIEFRLQQDLLGTGSTDERTMVVLRIAPVGQPMPESPWSVHVRGHWPERTDRLARVGSWSGKKLRKAFSPKRRNLPPTPTLPLAATRPIGKPIEHAFEEWLRARRKPVPTEFVPALLEAWTAAVAYAARKLDRSAARKADHLRAVHSTLF